ncbi:MAG: hypothetical protein HYV94_08035, partial [Candidatus Rokubacteria bacterium]|nr:hypothetical protein [Candidatus Rokubacteria bacterium]
MGEKGVPSRWSWPSSRSRPRYNRSVKALLVDLDDTLLDYSGGVDRHWEAAVA